MFVVVVWFCRSSSLAFLISAYLINLMHRFLLHWVICFGGYLFVHTPVSFFLKNTWFFLCFPICSPFGRQLCQNCGWAGSEPYVQSHITEPPCWYYMPVVLSNIFFYHGQFSINPNDPRDKSCFTQLKLEIEYQTVLQINFHI